MKRIAILVLFAACGGDDGSPAQSDAAIDSAGSGSVDAAVDAPSTGGPFAVTSPMLTEGATIAAANTCDGANTSPELAWTGNAMGAMSYAVVLTDKTNNLVHWVIYDIPAAATGLPAAVQKVYAPANVAGAHQTPSYQATVRGYLGPCPPMNGGPHTYEFAVYGIDAATLTSATMTTTAAQGAMLIMQHDTAKTTLTGVYER